MFSSAKLIFLREYTILIIENGQLKIDNYSFSANFQFPIVHFLEPLVGFEPSTLAAVKPWGIPREHAV